MTYTLQCDQPDPARGDTVTFSGTFPQEAFKQARNPQFHDNPYLTVLIADANGQTVFSQQTSFVKGARNPDGSVNGTSYPMLLGGPGIGQANAGYWTYDNKTGAVYHQVAVIESFPVGA